MIVETYDPQYRLNVSRGKNGYLIGYAKDLNDPRVRELKSVAQDGLPRGWINYDPYEPCQGFVYFSRGFKPPFVAKIKANTNLDHIRGVRGRTNEECWEMVGLSKQSALVATTVLNEMRNAPFLLEICRTDEMRDIVSRYGYSELEYVPPVLGYVGAEGRKIVYYNMVNGLFLGEPANPSPLPKLLQHSMVEEVSRYFLDKGIEPGDLAPRQLQVDHNQSTLYLFDAEAYVMTGQVPRLPRILQAA